MRKAKAIVVGLDAVSMPLVKRFADEGALPNLKKMMRGGICGEAQPCIPAYTPTNWATICTGAYPGGHGAANWADYEPTSPASRAPISTFDSRTITAETIFEAADRQGLVPLAMAYPGAYPSRMKKGMVAIPLHRGLVSLCTQHGVVYSSPEEALPRTEALQLRKASGWKGLCEGETALEGEISMQGKLVGRAASVSGPEAAKKAGGTEDGADIETIARAGAGASRRDQVDRLTLNILLRKGTKGYEKLLVCEGKDARRKLAELKPGQWSAWVVANVPSQQGRQKGYMRFKLVKLTRDGKRLVLLRSEVYPAAPLSYPRDLGKELIENVGPYIEHAAASATGTALMETILEEMDYQVEWQIRAARYLMETRGWDVFYNHWHFPDNVEHFFLEGADPDSPAYDRKLARKYLDVLRKSYALGDKLIGGLVQMADANTFVAMISDHGNVPNKYTCNMPRLLKRKGLTVFKATLGPLAPFTGKSSVDWAKSRAYPYGGGQICVNLKGREAEGIVDPADYEKVQEEVIDALLDWRDPASGKRAVAFALKKKDASLVGYWGRRCGDVIFIYNSGFAWGPGGERSTIAPARRGANHGPQIPTTRTALSSNMASLVMAGPGLKKGYERNPDALGFMRLVDFVPTLCYALGIEPPATSQGSVMLDLFAESGRRQGAGKRGRRKAR